jgi:hypothetical protein
LDALIVPSCHGAATGNTSIVPGVTTPNTHRRRVAFCTTGSSGSVERSKRM